MSVAVLFGTATGNTEVAAGMIVEALKPEYDFPLVDVARIKAEDLKKYKFIIAAVPTWNIGELESGWQDIVDKLGGVDLSGLHVAMVGMGDQANYPDTYQDAMGILYNALLEAGASGGIGFTSTEGHQFEASAGVIDDQFCGLALDDDNQAGETEERITNWVVQIKEALKNLGI
jgi:flavodoxin I